MSADSEHLLLGTSAKRKSVSVDHGNQNFWKQNFSCSDRFDRTNVFCTYTCYTDPPPPLFTTTAIFPGNRSRKKNAFGVLLVELSVKAKDEPCNVGSNFDERVFLFLREMAVWRNSGQLASSPCAPLFSSLFFDKNMANSNIFLRKVENICNVALEILWGHYWSFAWEKRIQYFLQLIVDFCAFFDILNSRDACQEKQIRANGKIQNCRFAIIPMTNREGEWCIEIEVCGSFLHLLLAEGKTKILGLLPPFTHGRGKKAQHLFFRENNKNKFPRKLAAKKKLVIDIYPRQYFCCPKASVHLWPTWTWKLFAFVRLAIPHKKHNQFKKGCWAPWKAITH